MKKLLVRVLLFVICICLLPVLATAESWSCEACGSSNTMNFCGNCGAARSKWICTKCETQNVSNNCSFCGLTHDASEILTKFDITPRIDLAPILKNSEMNDGVFFIDASETVYMGDYSLDANFLPALNLANTTDVSLTCSITLKVSGETINWSDKTIAGNDSQSFYVTYLPLTAGTYDYEIYIDGIAVASGQYKLESGTSLRPTRNYSVHTGLRIYDDQTGSQLMVGTDTVDINDLKEGQKFEPTLTVDNSSNFAGMTIQVGAIVNNTDACFWKEVYIEPNSSHTFRYDRTALKQGKNEVVWFINGHEVTRDTFTFINDPNKSGE